MNLVLDSAVATYDRSTRRCNGVRIRHYSMDRKLQCNRISHLRVLAQGLDLRWCYLEDKTMRMEVVLTDGAIGAILTYRLLHTADVGMV